MMISPEGYRKELENLTPEELYERKKGLEKFINDYENNNLPQQDYLVKPSPQTRYGLYKEYLNEVIDEIGMRRHQSELNGVKVSKSQCADCKNYLGDINCKIYGEIASDILGNKKTCPERKDGIVEDENSFEFLNKKIEKLTKELAEAYRNNDQEQITKLQDKIKEATDKQLKKDVDKLVKEDIKKEKEYIKQNLDKEKIKEQQKVIDEINKRIVAYLVENWTMSTPEFKALKQELRVAISRMECYKNAIYDEKEIERFYNEGILLEEEILGKASYINRENLLNKLGYLYNYKEKRNNYLTEKDFILDELKTIKNELMSNDGIEIPYTPCVRAQHCINEFIYYLERNQANDCLMDIYEVIESDKNTIYNDHFNKDYKYSTYIGNEEKSIILNMVNRLEAHLNNSNNQYSTEKLFEKAKSDFNIFVENEYGNNKSLSLPLPVSHNKLKSLILLSAVEENAEIYNCGYVLIDTISGNIEYELQPEHLLSNDPNLNLLNFIPKKEILINSKEEYDSLYSKYFKLLDDLILMYYSKKEYISKTDKIEEFLNIYRNIVSESEQIEYSLNNEFLSWCLISVPRQEIKKLNFEKSTAIIRETYLDENGHERDRERTIEVPNFSNNNLIDKIDNKLKEINPNYEVPAPLDMDNYNKDEKHNVNELIEKIDKKIEKINNEIAIEISNEIKKLPDNSEFNFQQFMKNYDITDKEKFSISNLIIDYCKNNNIVIVEKMTDADLGLPWNIPRIKKDNKNNKELTDIIDEKLQEFDDNTANNLKKYLLEITEAIINLPNDVETTISQIINYKPEINFVDPLTQGIIYNKVNEICKEIKINIQSTYDKFGGLAFHYTFVKMKENEIYVKPKPQQVDAVDNISTINTNKTTDDNTPEIYFYEFVPYKQIGPIMLNIEDNKDFISESAPYLANTRKNFVMCRPIGLDNPYVLKRKLEDHKIYIKYNNNEIKITCYFQKFIEDLKVICDDLVINESYSDNKKHFYAYSEKLGITFSGIEEFNQLLIHYLCFYGKDTFIKELNTYKDLTINNKKTNQEEQN